MTRHSQRPPRQPFLALLASLGLAAVLLAAPAPATATVPTVGSSNPATADPPVPRPPTKPCTVTLFSDLQFADFNPKTFTYTPPAACPGPWAKVVLEGDFSVSAGRQFDRTALIAIGHVNVYFGTTPEPSSTFSPLWHVERDLTDYSSLFTAAQTGDVDIGNLVNATFTGVITGSAQLQLYPVARVAPAPRTADLVLPLSDAPGGAVLLTNTASTLTADFSLPTNVERAYLDVVTQSQSNDEFWYTCVPNDVTSELESCGGTAFREGEVTIDGQPAGVAPVYPWIFTGGIDPLLWRPIPGVQTLSFAPYRVDLTPFAGLLSVGREHQVSVSVFNSNNYFQVTATLALYLDAGSRQVTGAVTENTIGTGPAPSIKEDLTTGADGTLSGSVTTTSSRQFTVAGFVNTSHGRVATRVSQTVDFSNVQQFQVSASQFVQDISQMTSISTGTQTRTGGEVRFAANQLTYPLAVDITVNLNADGSGSQTTTIAQAFDHVERDAGGGPPFSARIADSVASGDTLLFNAAGAITGFQGSHSSQSYFAQQTGLACYSRSLASQLGVLTAVVDGAGCKAH
ncbi:MAG TPA: peptide-N4-asparagine amidase [Thermoanaerobaculia bacterium]|nr:peptide-N4-asparagine amidase [Thermoanaerobaculia bacterium]